MNEQLPPVDRTLAEQLARRSAGRPPAGLLPEVLSAVDSAPSAPVVRLTAFGTRARVSGALVGLAAVVVLVAALVAVPALHTSPAATSLPSDRALTTAELAAVMSGPALPLNTALVADVTIRSNPDVCPMNRYPTLGVVEGMPSQVCVMVQTVPVAIAESGRGSGTFAFRYLAPGVLGLLGKITTPSSGLAFKVADEWPLQGQTFVVDGWLGNSRPVGYADSCASVAPAGDVLSPEGTADCPRSQDWLSDTTTPSAIDSPAASALADQSMDPSALFGNARLVQAYGARQIDGIDESHPDRGPVRGRYVVKSQTGACPGASAVSSVGCAHWLVVAKLADDLRTEPSVTATAPQTPTQVPSVATPVPWPSESPSSAETAGPAQGSYPNDRALTADELARYLKDGVDIKGTTVIASVRFAQTNGCPGYPGYQALGLLADTGLQGVCVVGSGKLSPNAILGEGRGIYAFHVFDSKTLGFVDNVTVPGDGPIALGNEAWPKELPVLVQGALFSSTSRFDCPPITAAVDPLNPAPIECGMTWLAPEATGGGEIDDAAAQKAGYVRVFLPWTGADRPSLLPSTAKAVYLLRWVCATSCAWEVMARVDRIQAAVELTAPPATPALTPSPPANGASTVLAGPNGTPLTLAQLYAAWKADAHHLAGRTVITKGPLPASTACLTADGLSPCDYAIAGEGYWVAQFGSDGSIKLVGKLSVPKSGFMWTVEELNVFETNSGALVVVDGPLMYDPNCQDPSLQCSTSEIAGKANVIASVNPGAYEAITGGSTGSDEIPGPFLVKLVSPYDTVIGRLEAFTP